MYLNEIYFVLVWVQPIFWMLFFNFKFKWLDGFFLRSVSYVFGLAALVIVYTDVLRNGLMNILVPSAPLYVIYFTMYYIFTTYLITIHEWHAPQALSASAMIVFVGSFLWETPYLIRNAFITGPQGDWWAHLTGLFFFWYIKDGIGWTTDKKTQLLFPLSLLISTILMLNWPIPMTEISGTVWNSSYYLSNRIISTVLAFIMLRKERTDVDEWRMIQK